MKLTDIIELAKQGYKPSDIKELISLSTEQVTDSPSTSQGDNNSQQTETQQNETRQEEDKPTDQLADDKQAGVDYKLLYEESQKKLAELQQKNTQKNIKDENQSTDEELVADIFKSFM